MRMLKRLISYLWRLKNRQVKALLERISVLEESNSVLSAYIAFLVKEKGILRVPRSEIGRLIGRFSASVSTDRDDYVIQIVDDGKGCDGNE